MARVAVVIPAFNCEPYVADALRSVCAQTNTDWEAVLVDDCSTDRTLEIAREFESWVKLLQTDENSGAAAAKQVGIMQTQSELIAFLDADDYWLPEYLDSQIRLFDEHRARDGQVGLVACDAYLLGPEGHTSDETYMDKVPLPAGLSLTSLLVANPIYTAVLTPRRVVEEVGGFDVDLFPVEDWDLWLRIVERGYSVVPNRRPLAVYRVSPTSVSGDFDRVARASQRLYQRALGRGNLSSRQRRLVRRKLRLQRALEAVAQIAAARRRGRMPYAHVAAALPLFLVVALENPNRWLAAARLLARGQRRPLLVP